MSTLPGNIVLAHHFTRTCRQQSYKIDSIMGIKDLVHILWDQELFQLYLLYLIMDAAIIKFGRGFTGNWAYVLINNK